MTQIDPWFLRQVRDGVVVRTGTRRARRWRRVTAGEMRRAKRDGVSDTQLWRGLWNSQPLTVRARRKELGVRAGVQPRGHVRGRVRELHAVPVFELRERVRGEAVGPQEGR